MDKVFIESVKISNLWNQFDVNWKLDPKVNILIGKNGTGKSTILNIIESVVTNNEVSGKYSFNEVSILLSNKKSILKEGAEETLHEEISDILKVLKEVLETGKFQDNNIKEKIKEIKSYKPILELIKISTFDMELKNKRNILNKKKENIQTELDLILDDLINDFKLYQLKLKNKVEKESDIIDKKIKSLGNKVDDLFILQELVQEKEKKVDLIFKSKDKFISILSKLFKNTNKILDLDENNSIIFRTGDKIITPCQLSSGEKQMLIILLTIIVKENKPFILLMDEPEISLHVEWQRDFLDNLISLNSNMQIILATHSPAIVSNGWMDKIINISDIVSKVK